MSSDYVKEMADVYKCMDILKKCETWWAYPLTFRFLRTEVATSTAGTPPVAFGTAA